MANENPTREIETREKQEVEREQTRPGLVFRPDVDIVERADEFLVTADLPGVDEQHVDVRLEKAGYEAVQTEVLIPSKIDGYPVVDLPFELIDLVMKTSAQAGYPNFRFVVLKK